ncbi:MAG: YbaK/EbsC family protein [Candidatus Bathyarchaeota archaeon]|nr:YbaK/EbsC family protein [Candidatus Bathyarchaeota archaeon]
MGVLQLRSIMDLLDRIKIHYTVSEHEPVYTSKQAAKIRGVEQKTGVKALVLRTKEGGFVMGLVAADRRMDLNKLAKIAETKSLELASPKEVLETTGCEVGAVHPFGNLHGLPTYMDVSVLESDLVNFNAGLHTVSIQMKAKDLVKAVGPVIDKFSRR